MVLSAREGMEVDARAAGDERDLAGAAGDRLGLGGEGHGGDPMRGGGTAALDGEGEAGEAAGQVDGAHVVGAFAWPSRVRFSHAQ